MRAASGTPLAKSGTVSAATAPPATGPPGVYKRHRPETTALYEVVRDNLETLYGAFDDGALAVRIPKHARKELEAYLDCGLLSRLCPPGVAGVRREAAGGVQLLSGVEDYLELLFGVRGNA